MGKAMHAGSLHIVLMVSAISANADAATRVYYQDFDDPAQVEAFWLDNERGSKSAR